MRKRAHWQTRILLLALLALASSVSAQEPWVCRYKGYTNEGMHYWIAIKPFYASTAHEQYLKLNSNEFASSIFSRFVPGYRSSGEPACALRPGDASEAMWKKVEAGNDMFIGEYNSTLLEWNNGELKLIRTHKVAK